jgi:hypothetical protein
VRTKYWNNYTHVGIVIIIQIQTRQKFFVTRPPSAAGAIVCRGSWFVDSTQRQYDSRRQERGRVAYMRLYGRTAKLLQFVRCIEENRTKCVVKTTLCTVSTDTVLLLAHNMFISLPPRDEIFFFSSRVLTTAAHCFDHSSPRRQSKPPPNLLVTLSSQNP